MFSREGKNWRLIRDYKRGKYCYLIGVYYWAIELQEHEFNELYLLIEKLNNEFLALKSNLMDEELFNLEFEQLQWYAELEGTKNGWSLRIIFDGDEQSRSFEMYWPIQIAENLFFEIKQMWDSMH